MKDKTVLVVDDEANMRRVLEIMLARRGFKTFSASDGREALEQIQAEHIDLVVSDMQMPLLNGIELLRSLRKQGNEVPFIMITAHGTIETAVEAMKLGACDYLLRPFDIESLDLAMERVFAAREVLQHKQFLETELDRSWPGLIGNSVAMQRVKEQIAQVAPTTASVLLSGETGTGKEVVARAIHKASARAGKLFVAINCAAIPADVLESELFGHEKGAFTGALKQRTGKFELANGGTVFLDEITEMPIQLQSKLLRVLQEGQVQRVGGNDTIELDLRVIAASNRDTAEAIRSQHLRQDLYFRLNVFSIALPALRERKDDIADLVDSFVGTQGEGAACLSGAALDHLKAYDWPGNVRELQNMVERARILSRNRLPLEVEHFPLDAGDPTAASAAQAGSPRAMPDNLCLETAVAGLECELIREALERTEGNKTRAAQLLEISERSIWYKIKKYGLGGS